MKDEDLKKIHDALGLKSDATIDDILSAIEDIMGDSPKATVDNAIAQNFVKLYERQGLLKMAQTDIISFRKYLSDRKADYIKEKRIEVHQLVNEAFRDGRIFSTGNPEKVKEYWIKAFDHDFEGSKAALQGLNKRPVYSDIIKNVKGTPGDRSGWSLTDYRKKAPGELQNNPELYQRLIEEEKIFKTNK